MTRPRLRNSVGRSRNSSGALAAIVLFCCLGSSSAQSEPAGGAASVSQKHAQTASNATPGEPRTVSWRSLVPNLVADQQQIWTFPLQVAQGRHSIPTLAITGAAAGLIALDPHDTPYFRRTSTFDGFNQVFSGTTTALGIAIVPTSFYLVGLKRHDAYAQKTALFSAESLADGVILDTALKAVTRRERPRAIPPSGNFSDTWFKTGWGSAFSGEASFPSVHTTAAFSVATVIARRYGHRHWVPWVAYGLAGVVGFSRVTNQAHFPSDVFVGAALGYSISRFAVLGQ